MKIIVIIDFDMNSVYLIKTLLENNISLMGIVRQGQKNTCFKDIWNRSKKIMGSNSFLAKLWSFLGFQVGLRYYLRRCYEKYLKSEKQRYLLLEKDALKKDSETTVYHTFDINSKESELLITRLNPDFIIVMGGRILKNNILKIPKLGLINLHLAILPQYRGTGGVFWPMYFNDFDNIGYTIHFLDEGLDTGDIILQERITVKKNEPLESIGQRVLDQGVLGVVRAVEMVMDGNIKRIPQKISSKIYRMPTKKQIAELKERMQKG